MTLDEAVAKVKELEHRLDNELTKNKLKAHLIKKLEAQVQELRKDIEAIYAAQNG